MFHSLSARLQTLSADVRSLTGNHWDMLKQEVAGNIKLTRRQLVVLAVGAVVGLTAVVMLLMSLTFLLARLLEAQANLEPLTATALSAGILALLFGIAGAVLAVRASGKLSGQTLKPVHTLQSFSQSVHALAASPVLSPPAPAASVTVTAAVTTPPVSVPVPPPASKPLTETNDTMNTRQNFENAANTVDDTVHRVRQNLGDTLYNLTQKVEINPLAAAAIDWVSTYLDQRSNRQAAANSFSGTVSRAMPLSPAALGLAGIGYLLWQQLTRPAARQAASDFADYGRERAQNLAGRATHAYQESADSVASAGRRARETVNTVRETAHDTANRWADTAKTAAATARETGAHAADRARSYYDNARSAAEDGIDHLSETAQRLRHNAEEGYERVRDFAEERPAAAAAAGVLAVGLAALLIRNASRR